MMRDDDKLELRSAFREEPERCHAALMDAVRSVREEQKTMKKISMRTMLIAAVIVLSMLTTAFAAGEIFGWTDYFEAWGIHTTPGLRNAMQTEQRNISLGPVTFTVQETVADNRLAMASAKIAMTDGSQALLCMFADDPVGAYGDRSRVLMNALGLTDGAQTCFEAGAQKGLPVYAVRACVEVDEAFSGGEGMEDILWDAQGNAAYLSSCSLNPDAVGDELTARLFLRVAQIDANGEEIQKWTTREEISVPVSKKLAEKTYRPEQPLQVKGAEIREIHAELYATGAYLTFAWQMPEGMAYDETVSMWEYHHDDLLLTDGSFNVFEQGVSLSAGYDSQQWPLVTVEEMINVDALPEVIRISDGVQDVAYR